MRPGGKWFRLRFVKSAALLSQDTAREGGVEVVTQRLTFSYPSLNARARQALRVLGEKYCLHMMVQDTNGFWHYLGVSHLVDRRVWVSENLRTSQGSATTNESQETQIAETSSTIECISSAVAPFLAPTFSFSELTIEDPVDDADLPPDTSPPVAVDFIPQEGSDFLSRDFGPLRIDFNEPVVPSGGGETAWLRRFDDDTIVQTWTASETGRVSVDNLTNSLLLDRGGVLLDYDTAYYVEVQSGFVEDLAGNEWPGIAKAAGTTAVWYLRTQPVPDTTGPSVSEYVPTSGGTQALAGDNPEVVWDEAVQAGQGNVTLTRVSDSSVVAILNVATSPRVSVSGDRLVLDVLDLLEGLTEYTISGPVGIMQDSSFNDSDAFSWTFQTGADTRPGVVDVVFSPTPPNVGVANTPAGTFDGKGFAEGASVIEIWQYDQATGLAGEVLITTLGVGDSFVPALDSKDRYLQIFYYPVNENGVEGSVAKSDRRKVEDVVAPPTATTPLFAPSPPQIGVANTPDYNYSSPGSTPEGATVVKVYQYDGPSGTAGETVVFNSNSGAAWTPASTAPNLRYVEYGVTPVDANGVAGTEVRSARVLLEPTDITVVNDIAASLWEYWEADNVILDGSGNVETLTGKKGVLNLAQVTPSRRATVAPANTPNGNDAVEFVWGANMAYSSALSGTNFPTNGVIVVFGNCEVSSGTYPSFFATTNGGDTINTGLFIFHENNAYRFRYGTPTNSHNTGSRVLPQPYSVLSLAYGTSVFRSWLDTSEVGSNLSLAVTPDYSNIIVGGPTVGTGFPNGSLYGKIAGVYVFSTLDLYAMRQLQKFLIENG